MKMNISIKQKNKTLSIDEMQKELRSVHFFKVGLSEEEREILLPTFQKVVYEMISKDANKGKYLTDLLLDLATYECFAIANIKEVLITYGDIISPKTFEEMFKLLMHFK